MLPEGREREFVLSVTVLKGTPRHETVQGPKTESQQQLLLAGKQVQDRASMLLQYHKCRDFNAILVNLMSDMLATDSLFTGICLAMFGSNLD